MVFYQDFAEAFDGLGFLRRQATGADDLPNTLHRLPRHIEGVVSEIKQRRCNLVDSLIGALGA